MRLTSPAFSEGDAIPREYSEHGPNLLPPLEIEGVPPEAGSLAMVIEDRDSPLGEGVTHWLAWNIPPGTRYLHADHLPEECRVGTDSFGEETYTGPNPPAGRHRYRFRVLALDGELALKPGATRVSFERAIKGRVLAEAELTGTAERYMDEEDRD